MGRLFTFNQENFGVGELAPSLYGKRSFPGYASSLKTARNFFGNKNQNMVNRPGSVWGGQTLYANKKSRLIPFIFSNTDAYVLEFGDKYLRFIQNNSYLFDSSYKMLVFPNAVNPTITLNSSLTNLAWNPGDQVYISQVVGPLAQWINNRFFLVKTFTPGASASLTLTYMDGTPVDSTLWGAFYNTPGTVQRVYTVASPYAATDNPLLKFAQSFDVTELRHPNYYRQRLTRTTAPATLFPIFNLDNTPLGPSQLSEVTGMVVAPGASGTNNYLYRVTTVNLKSGVDSYPGVVGGTQTVNSIGVASAVFNNTTGDITITTVAAHGLATGNSVSFSSPWCDSLLGFSRTYTIQSKDRTGSAVLYPVVVTGGLTFTIQGTGRAGATPPSTVGHALAAGYFNASGTFIPGSPFVNTFSTGAGQQIVSISTDFPAKVTMAANHNLATGAQVLIQNTGVFGFDNAVFAITIDPVLGTVFYLNGVDGSQYQLPVGPLGSAAPTTAVVTACDIPTIQKPNVISWELAPSSGSLGSVNIGFNVYRSEGGIYGFIGFTASTSYNDDGTVTPDTGKTPPDYNPLFVGPQNNPSAVNFYQQRLIELSTIFEPQGIFASVISDYTNFSTHDPIQANDAIIDNIASNNLNKVVESVDAGFLILLTDRAPMVVQGDQTGTLTPLEINVKKQMFNGCSPFLRPIHVNKNVIFAEALSNVIRDLQILTTPYYTYIAGSTEVSLTAEHLLAKGGHTLVDWDFAQYPDSVIYGVREDGQIIPHTYNPDLQLSTWTRWDTQGTYESVCCIPENGVIYTYVMVARQVNGQIIRSFERFDDRTQMDLDILNANFLDCSGSFDGRNITSTTMTLSGGTNWDRTEALTLTANTTFFVNGMVGDYIFLTGPDGTVVRFKIETLVNLNGNITNQVTGTVERTVPDGVHSFDDTGDVFANMRNVPLATWSHAISTVSGLWNLNGQQVEVFGDGYIESNPYNLKPGQQAITVVNGQAILSNPYAVIRVGLPYFQDLQTVDIDDAKTETFLDKVYKIQRVTTLCKFSRGYYAGTQNPDTNPKSPQNKPGIPQTPNYLYGLVPPKPRQNENYDSPNTAITGRIQTILSSTDDYGQNVFIRNPDALPLTITNIAAAVELPVGGR